MNKIYKQCQSCGMPFRGKKENYGIEKDGTQSRKYCSLCYKDGEFVKPEIDTAKKMQDFCVKVMKEDGMNGVLSWLLTRQIPKLERWRDRK
jgi:hypothetical protein